MADMMIGRGAFLFEIPDSLPGREILSYTIQSDGISFYDPSANFERKDLHDFLLAPAAGRTQSIGSSTGHISLVSLPASPQDAFYNVSLRVSAADIKLQVTQSGEFAHRSDTFFKDLDLTFTDPRGEGALRVDGRVNLCLFGRADIDIELSPSLTAEGLVFKPASTMPAFFEVDGLGRLRITRLEVNANHDRWADLQALYTFDELAGERFLDLSGTQDSDGNVQSAIDLSLEGEAGDINQVPGGISIGTEAAGSNHETVLDSRSAGRKIIEACMDSNALSIVAWVKPFREAANFDPFPARIVSLSQTITQRNFTLGQNDNRYIVRLRRENGDGPRERPSFPGEPPDSPPDHSGGELPHHPIVGGHPGDRSHPSAGVPGEIGDTDRLSRSVPADRPVRDAGGAHEDVGERHHVPASGRGEPPERVVARAAIGNRNGVPPLISKPQRFPKSDVDYVVFTRGDADSHTPAGKIYVNGEDQTEQNPEDLAPEDFTTDLSGDFSRWSRTYPLLLGNEKSGDRPWNGEIHRVAVYSRALSAEEIKYSYVPKIELEAKLALSHSPAPFDAELSATADLDADQLIVVEPQLLAATPFLQFNQIALTWEQNGSELHFVSGKTGAALWGNPVELDVSVTADEFQLSRTNAAQKTLVLNDMAPLSPLGEILLTQLALSANRTAGMPAWRIETDGQVTFATIPPPLKGPFPVTLFLDDGKLWFSIHPDAPLSLIGALQFDQAQLRFVRDDGAGGGWQAQSDLRGNREGVVLPLFDEARSLTARLESAAESKVLALEWTAAVVDDRLGRLNLAHFLLRSAPVPGRLFWQLEMAGSLPLADMKALDFSTHGGEILGDPEDGQQPRRLQGQSLLERRDSPIFEGDLSFQDTRFLLNGHLNLFPAWSLVQVEADPQFEIAVDGRVSIETTSARTRLPDSELINPTLNLTAGRLALSGFWLGQPKAQRFHVRERGEAIFLDGLVNQFTLPFSLNLPALIDEKTGTELSPAAQIADEVMHIKLDAEFQEGGFTAVLNANFDYPDVENVIQRITLPERRLYLPPRSSLALLGDILDHITDTADELFSDQGRHGADYYVGAGPEQPQIFLSTTGSREPQIRSELPAVFEAAVEISSPDSTFSLNQTGGNCQLTLNVEGKDQATIRADYDAFMGQVAEGGLRSAGATALLKRRIAERLPLDYDNLLYYYYGWDIEKGFIDLQAGMRLRVDLQNYQFVRASDTSARPGFVGSGSIYIPVNSYIHPPPDGNHDRLLGFGPFLSRLQVKSELDITNKGAGGLLDLLKVGYRKAYYRLFFPEQPAGGAGIERSVTLIGANSLQKMIAATDAFVDAGSLSPTLGTTFFFRGKAVILPEIQIYVGSNPTYVPVGTTLRQLIEMVDELPSAGLPGQDLRPFSGSARPLRLVHDGLNSTPGYRFINFATVVSVGNMDLLDLPLVKGDRLSF